MSLLGKLVPAAKATGGGEFIRDGEYLFAVENMLEINGYEGVSCVVELLVVEATQIDPQVKPNPIGSSCSCVWNSTKNREVALGNIKKFLMGLFGVPEDQITTDAYEAAIDQDKMPLRGMVIRARTFHKQNQGRFNSANRGQDLVLPKWQNVEQTEEDVAKRRAAMDAKKPAEPAANSATAQTPAPPKEEPKAIVDPAKKSFLAGVLGKK